MISAGVLAMGQSEVIAWCDRRCDVRRRVHATFTWMCRCCVAGRCSAVAAGVAAVARDIFAPVRFTTSAIYIPPGSVASVDLAVDRWSVTG
jgi:hypothetical protein